MSRPIQFLLVGVILGAGVAAVIVLALDLGGTDNNVKLDDIERQLASLERDNERLTQALAAERMREDGARIQASSVTDDLDDLIDEPPPVEEIPAILQADEVIEDPVIRDEPMPTELTDEDLEDALKSLGSSLQGLMLGSSKTFHEKVQAILARGGPGTVDRILEIYENVEGLQAKAVLAHALVQTDDPKAIATLQDIARSADAGLFDRRTATHGLAFSDQEGLEDYYREIANNPQIEIGARANSAYGLARRSDEGIEVYGTIVDQAFQQKDAFALAYLSGFQILGKRSVPAVEKRLATIREPQARLVMVAHLAEHGSASSAAALRALAAEPDVAAELRNQANAAADKLEAAAAKDDD